MAPRTCFREEYYTGMRRYYWAGEDLQARTQENYIYIYIYIYILLFFIDISVSLCSFGLALCVVREYVIVLLWIAAGPSRKSIWERLGWYKVTGVHGNVTDFINRGRLTSISGPFRAQGSALTRNVSRLHGSKILLQKAILYRHEKILLGRE